MENYKMMRKFKIIISCIVIAFVVAVVVAAISFVQVGNARRANAEYERQLEQVEKEKDELEKDYESLQSGEGKDESARDNGLIPENEYEINTK